MKIERTKKEVIDAKLLAALDDEAKVACVFDCEDLDTLITALRCVPNESYERLARDLEMLRKSAFGR